MKILIIGDSFAADWSVKYKEYKGWPNILAEEFDVHNIAQAGIGQYKILKQIQSVNVSDYDCVISSYTSPYRVHTHTHPVHNKDELHKNCDLLAGDIEYWIKNDQKNNESLITARNWFKYHFDFEYQDDIHKLLIKECDRLIYDIKHLKVSNLISDHNISLSFKDLCKKHPGIINHMSKEGNCIVANEIKKLL